MAEQGLDQTIHPRDREMVALTYLLAIIPLFGILAAAVIALTYQERSRTVVFHAKQAIAAQAVMLLLFVVICIFSLFAVLVGVLSPRLKTLFLDFDTIVFYITGIVYLLWCLYMVWMSLSGNHIELPLVGPRMRDKSE